MVDLTDISKDTLYPGEFAKIGVVLKKHLPASADIEELQLYVIKHIRLARGEVDTPDVFFEGVKASQIDEKNSFGRLKKGILEFRAILNDGDIHRWTTMEIKEGLIDQGSSPEQFYSMLDVIENVADKEFDFDFFWHKDEPRGRKVSARNWFVMLVGERLEGRLKPYPMSVLISEILGVFGVDASPSTINYALNRVEKTNTKPDLLDLLGNK
jgi:hypothetical protein